ncbi:AAA family ATPase [Desertimonas flava]|uniref:AAA family ATPase n=1 Tax=Desertimonas flava TaxID=2064846 RepID=UPI0013C45AD6|nr:AAA family ATPase [Desertimonas flava]
MLIVMSGLPGTGKSAIADELGRRRTWPVLSVDPVEAAIWRCGITASFETGVAAYEVAATLAEHQLRIGLSVIADAVNALEVARDMWRRVCERTDAAMRVIEVVCSDVDEHRRRLEGRIRGIDGFPEPTWGQVSARREEWQPWTVDHLTLDSIDPLDRNVERALRYLVP